VPRVPQQHRDTVSLSATSNGTQPRSRVHPLVGHLLAVRPAAWVLRYSRKQFPCVSRGHLECDDEWGGWSPPVEPSSPANDGASGTGGASVEPVGTATSDDACNGHGDCAAGFVCVSPAVGSQSCETLGGTCQRTAECDSLSQCGYVGCRDEGICQCYRCEGADSNCITGEGCFSCQTDPG
jgi:hypothetical protein